MRDTVGGSLVTDYAISTNLIVWAAAKGGIFGWPDDGLEADAVAQMVPGDLLVPKFAQSAVYQRGGGQSDYQREICAVHGLDYDVELKAYNDKVNPGGNSGAGAIPCLLRVTGQRPDDDRYSSPPWKTVGIEIEWLDYPLSTQEFLALRVTEPELARQFKATAAKGRHIQKLKDGTAAAIREIAKQPVRGPEVLRQYVMVWSGDQADAMAKLTAAGHTPRVGDKVFLAHEQRMLGIHDVAGVGSLVGLVQTGETIQREPLGLRQLFADAMERVKPGEVFRAQNAVHAAKELEQLAAEEDNVLEIRDFPTFHDRYVVLPRKITEALELAKRAKPEKPPEETTDEDGDGETVELDELENLKGLDVAAVRNQLPDFELPHSVLAEAVTALRSGKHLLLSGPPGTGKSTIAGALCRAVVDEQYDIVTATADWTTFDTIGGYLPREGGQLAFEPGIVLRGLKAGRWLVIDELNRADIDKAFGPLFTLLAGSGGDGQRPADAIKLPYQQGGKPIEITSAQTRADSPSPYTLTPGWRLLGTLNVSDKASLFQLSFAFLRRFAVVDVPLPPAAQYRSWFAGRVSELSEDVRGKVIDASIGLATEGRRELGPAILADVARFISVGLTETSSGGASYPDAIHAFITAVRLYAVPQYEGATRNDVDATLSLLRGVLDAAPAEPWAALEHAMREVALQ